MCILHVLISCICNSESHWHDVHAFSFIKFVNQSKEAYKFCQQLGTAVGVDVLSIGYNPPPSCMIFISTTPEGGVLMNIIQRGGGL